MQLAGKILLTVIVISFSIICSVQDIRGRRISNFILLFSILALVLLRFIFDFQDFWYSILCGMAAGLFYFIAQKLSVRRLGNADVIFGVFQGLILFPKWLFFCVMVECFFAAIFIFLFQIKNKNKVEVQIPFIPFMASGLLISYFLYLFLE